MLTRRAERANVKAPKRSRRSAARPPLRSGADCGQTKLHPPLQAVNENGIRMGDCCLKSVNVGTAAEARVIAVRHRAGALPGLFWLGGFKSDMAGTKAEALDRWAAEHERGCIRFDYSGHGESGGIFSDGTIGRWLEEALTVFETFAHGRQIVIGSSM